MTQEVAVPAGFWIRIIPALIDGIIVSAALHVATGFRYATASDMSMMDSFRFYALSSLLSGIYAGFFYSIKGWSPGKKVFSLEVVDNVSGERISFFRAFFRDSIGKLVSILPLGIGYMIAGFNRDGRTLHDYIFDTRVVKKTAVVEFHPARDASDAQR